MGNKGVAFVELLDTDFPFKSIKIKDEKLETASWNYSKGIIEIIIRTRSYQLVQVFVRDENNVRLPNLTVTLKEEKPQRLKRIKMESLRYPWRWMKKFPLQNNFQFLNSTRLRCTWLKDKQL